MLIGDVTYGGLQRGVPGEGQRRVPGRGVPAHPGPGDGRLRASASARTAPSTSVASAPAATGARRASCTYGLQKLTPNGANAFDMHGDARDQPAASRWSTRSRCRPRPPASLATKYQVKQWRYVPTPTYGGPKVDEETLTVTSATAVGRRQQGDAEDRRPAARPGGAPALAAPVHRDQRPGAVEHRGLVHAQRPRGRPAAAGHAGGGVGGTGRRRRGGDRPPELHGYRFRRRATARRARRRRSP